MNKIFRAVSFQLIAFSMMLYCEKNPVDDQQEETVTDVDGNVYQTVIIGTQIWLQSNLKVTHYRNGDPIPNVTDDTAWGNLTTGAYCNYDNEVAKRSDDKNVSDVATYGRLYNWFAVNDSRNIAPAGWHVPTDAEWRALMNYLGGESIAGGKMKEEGTTHWQSPNTGATNESGFTALPGGYRVNYGVFAGIGTLGYLWSSTEYNTSLAWFRNLSYDSAAVRRSVTDKQVGFSIRCIKNN